MAAWTGRWPRPTKTTRGLLLRLQPKRVALARPDDPALNIAARAVTNKRVSERPRPRIESSRRLRRQMLLTFLLTLRGGRLIVLLHFGSPYGRELTLRPRLYSRAYEQLPFQCCLYVIAPRVGRRVQATVDMRPAYFADLAGFAAFSERPAQEAAYSLMHHLSASGTPNSAMTC